MPEPNGLRALAAHWISGPSSRAPRRGARLLAPTTAPVLGAL